MPTALVLIAEGSEDIEAVTVIDVLRRGSVAVTVASVLGERLVRCAHGTRLVADELLASVADRAFDVLVLPGGSLAAQTYSAEAGVQELLRRQESAGRVVAVICASTLAIHAAGVFAGARATSYPSLRGSVEDKYAYEEQDVVVDGNLITSRGPATAMAFALAIVERAAGRAERDRVAEALLF